MPRRTVDPVVVPFNVTVVAGTAIAAPSITTPVLLQGTLEAIDLVIPPGHCGMTGIRFTFAGQQIMPWSNAIAWITGDDMKERFPVDFEIDTGLKVVAYNTGNFDHTFFLRFIIRQLATVTAPPMLRLINNEAI